MLTYIIIYFLYGLAFFSMGILVALEGGHSSDERLRKALRPLYGFGIVHGVYEFLKMFDAILVQLGHTSQPILVGVELVMLAFSFLSLAAFGSFLFSKTETAQRVSLIVPLALEIIWVFGLAVFHEQYTHVEMLVVIEAWTRYILAIPATLLAAIGLVAQQRSFRRAGLVRFGQDSLWAAVAFGWYGLVGQFFTAPGPLFPSNIINSDLFLNLFGFPVQILRAVTASAAALFVIRFLRAFQVESDNKIAELKEARLRESEQRESLRRELLQHTVRAQEDECARIARELHDETAQTLSAFTLELATLQNDKLRKSDMKQTVERLQTLSRNMSQGLYRLVHDLRPAQLDDLGLVPALRFLIEQDCRPLGLRVDFEARGTPQRLKPLVETALFRVGQEALTNLARHAQVQEGRVEIVYGEEGVTLRVVDRGRGFDPTENFRPPHGWGLAGMKERVESIGGTLQIISAPGQGTTIEVCVPAGVKEAV